MRMIRGAHLVSFLTSAEVFGRENRAVPAFQRPSASQAVKESDRIGNQTKINLFSEYEVDFAPLLMYILRI